MNYILKINKYVTKTVIISILKNKWWILKNLIWTI